MPSAAWRFNIHVRRNLSGPPLELKHYSFIHSRHPLQHFSLQNLSERTEINLVRRRNGVYNDTKTLTGSEEGLEAGVVSSHLLLLNKLLHVLWQQLQMLRVTLRRKAGPLWLIGEEDGEEEVRIQKEPLHREHQKPRNTWDDGHDPI